VTTEPNVLLVDPGLASMLEEKSVAFTLDATLQVNPFTVTPVFHITILQELSFQK
jgi:hypothetical protein